MSDSVKFKEYRAELLRYFITHPGQRYGQCAFNVLFSMDQKAANEIRATTLDPFYICERIPAFMDYLRARWAEPSHSPS